MAHVELVSGQLIGGDQARYHSKTHTTTCWLRIMNSGNRRHNWSLLPTSQYWSRKFSTLVKRRLPKKSQVYKVRSCNLWPKKWGAREGRRGDSKPHLKRKSNINESMRAAVCQEPCSATGQYKDGKTQDLLSNCLPSMSQEAQKRRPYLSRNESMKGK